MKYEELLQAYYACRQTKRTTANALKFEVDYESNLLQLQAEVNSGRYRPGRSIAFIVERPVKREIFAADFRDRVIHHWLIGKLNPYFEQSFIYDSYACRQDKGTLFGIKRVDRFIRRCSANYTQDCYVLKLDIQGFFMHIDRRRLWKRLESFVNERYAANDKVMVLELLRKVVDNNPTSNCVIKGARNNWVGLPKNKSLFYSPPGRGLPIGNLTSQVLANFYMSKFDHFVKHDLGVRYYGRYVDDFVIVHQDRDYLRTLMPLIRDFLQRELGLKLHPNKIYLQHYAKGLNFLGAEIKPGRIYSGKRLKGNFYDTINRHFPGSDPGNRRNRGRVRVIGIR